MASLSRRILLGVLALIASSVPRDSRAQDIIVRDGWEAFPNSEYRGGDASQTRKRLGVLVLTDTSLAFYDCMWNYCADRKQQLFEEKGLIWRLPLTQIKSVSSSTQNRGPSVTGRVLFGVLATDKNAEYFAFTYETERSAEAPVFQMIRTTAGALEAKLRFRLKKLGVELPP